MTKLPTPQAARGYMLFSDCHREAPIDGEFRVGHFTANRDLYLRALEWCDEQGYTVIENGDCEELWYEPTFAPERRLSKRDRLAAIVDEHAEVYGVLARLAKSGRYLRTVGNHDSYLWRTPRSASGAPTTRRSRSCTAAS